MYELTQFLHHPISLTRNPNYSITPRPSYDEGVRTLKEGTFPGDKPRFVVLRKGRNERESYYSSLERPLNPLLNPFILSQAQREIELSVTSVVPHTMTRETMFSGRRYTHLDVKRSWRTTTYPIQIKVTSYNASGESTSIFGTEGCNRNS